MGVDPARLLTVEYRRDSAELRILLFGRLDARTAPALQLPQPRAFDGVRTVVVDLSGLDSYDDVGSRRLGHVHDAYQAAGFEVRLIGGDSLLDPRGRDV